MEELRDERLGKIVTWMQSWARGYLSRKEFKRLQEQRLALQVCQRNLRKYLKLRTWPWYKLWQKVRPLLNVTRIEDEIAVSIPHSRIYERQLILRKLCQTYYSVHPTYLRLRSLPEIILKRSKFIHRNLCGFLEIL